MHQRALFSFHVVRSAVSSSDVADSGALPISPSLEHSGGRASKPTGQVVNMLRMVVIKVQFPGCTVVWWCGETGYGPGRPVDARPLALLDSHGVSGVTRVTMRYEDWCRLTRTSAAHHA